jgi:hypothetical protein
MFMSSAMAESVKNLLVAVSSTAVIFWALTAYMTLTLIVHSDNT